VVYIEQVSHTDAYPRIFINIGRADASQYGADLFQIATFFLKPVENDVVGHDNMSSLTDIEPTGIYSQLAQLLQFRDQAPRIYHDTVADDARHMGMQDASGDEVKSEFFLTEDNPVTGVASSLIAHHKVGVAGELIDDFALTLVTPLGTHNGHYAHARFAP
jgi:hypothetical protein